LCKKGKFHPRRGHEVPEGISGTDLPFLYLRCQMEQASYTTVNGFTPGVRQPRSGVDQPPHLLQRQKKGRSIPLLSLWAYVVCEIYFAFARLGEWKRHALTAFSPEKRPGNHLTGGWVGLRASLDRFGISHPTGIQSLDLPTHSELLYRLIYPGPHLLV
jgi:hypothetical protein